MSTIQHKNNYIFHFRDIPLWLRSDPIAFHLLAEFARRTSRTGGKVNWQGEIINLEPGQFITGRISTSEKLGIEEGQYRGAYKRLQKVAFIQTIRVTKRYTIGLYCADNVFYIHLDNSSPSDEPSHSPSANHPLTTNNTIDTEDTVSSDNKSRLKEKKIKTIKNFEGVSSLRNFIPKSAGESAAFEVWGELEGNNPQAFYTTYLAAAHRGLPPNLFYVFRSEIKQDQTIRNLGAVFNKKVEEYFSKRNKKLGGEAV